jgi:hypothetical protein
MSFLFPAAKVLLFFEMTKLFWRKMQKIITANDSNSSAVRKEGIRKKGRRLRL